MTINYVPLATRHYERYESGYHLTNKHATLSLGAWVHALPGGGVPFLCAAVFCGECAALSNPDARNDVPLEIRHIGKKRSPNSKHNCS